MAPLRLLSLKERRGGSWKGLESLLGASGVDGLKCPFPNGSIFAETWSLPTSFISCSWAALTVRKLTYRIGEGKEGSVQQGGLQALGPQLPLQGPQLLGQLPAVGRVDVRPEAVQQLLHKIPAQTGVLRRKAFPLEPRGMLVRGWDWGRPLAGVLPALRHQGALGRAAHLLLLQPQILRQLGQLLLQHLGQHGPPLALLMQQAQP